MELPTEKNDGESRLTTAVRSRIAAFDFGSRAADGSFSPGELSDTSEPVAVLLVDDNAVKRRSLAAILEPLDYIIVEAESGLEALGCVQAREFAVILLDVRMPVLNGIETAALLRRGTGSKLTPIIFVTAEDDDEIMRSNGFAKGGADFLITPVKPAELIAKVSVFASLYRHTRQLSARVIEVERYADGLNLLAECAPIGIFMTDSGNRFVYTKPPLERDHRDLRRGSPGPAALFGHRGSISEPKPRRYPHHLYRRVRALLPHGNCPPGEASKGGSRHVPSGT